MATNTLPAVDSQCEHEPKVGRGMCRRCYGRNYYRTKAEYRERLKEQKRKRYAANPEPFLEYSRQHYARNKDEHNARRREWRRNNPEWQRRTARAWRLRKVESTSGRGVGMKPSLEWSEQLLLRSVPPSRKARRGVFMSVGFCVRMPVRR